MGASYARRVEGCLQGAPATFTAVSGAPKQTRIIQSVGPSPYRARRGSRASAVVG